jgi:hypothetical protein
MTMTTIGYGDFVPTSNFSKIFTMIYAFTSIGVFVALAARLGGAMVQNTGRKKSKNKDKIKNTGI